MFTISNREGLISFDYKIQCEEFYSDNLEEQEFEIKLSRFIEENRASYDEVGRLFGKRTIVGRTEDISTGDVGELQADRR